MSAEPASAGNPKCKIDVEVHVKKDGTKELRVHPRHADMTAGQSDVQVVFHLKKSTQEANWAFPSTMQSDWDFYGIDIANGDDGQFYDAGCESGDAPDKVWVYNQNSNSNTYSYTVTLVNTVTGEHISDDPSIVNRSDMKNAPGARR